MTEGARIDSMLTTKYSSQQAVSVGLGRGIVEWTD